MTSLARIAFIPLLVAAAAYAEEKAPALPKNSPFGAPGAPVATAEAAGERIEFAAVSVVGKKTDLVFYDKTAKKSHWIAVGETKEGIAVTAYDERREQAIVKINGVEKVLPLRKGQRAASTPRPVTPLPTGFNIATPGPVPLPVPANMSSGTATSTTPTSSVTPEPGKTPAPEVPAAPTTPEAQAQVKQETEARMLLSDLLQIVMAQRKAYEEAQRKAAESPQAPQVVTNPQAQPARE
jgi:hypothetical protein